MFTRNNMTERWQTTGRRRRRRVSVCLNKYKTERYLKQDSYYFK